MNKLITFCVLLAGLAVAETYIIPARVDLGFAAATISMPENEWTNCVAWYDASFPTIGKGTSGFTVPDLSPAGNDATQPTVSLQPVHGGGSIETDGVDDWFVSAANWAASNLIISVDAEIQSGAASIDKMFGGTSTSYRWVGFRDETHIYIGQGGSALAEIECDPFLRRIYIFDLVTGVVGYVGNTVPILGAVTDAHPIRFGCSEDSETQALPCKFYSIIIKENQP